jgi:hypothetical protein
VSIAASAGARAGDHKWFRDYSNTIEQCDTRSLAELPRRPYRLTIAFFPLVKAR